MTIDYIAETRKPYPKGSIWEDASSYKKEDEKLDYYMMLDSWKFIGRFENFLDALNTGSIDDN